MSSTELVRIPVAIPPSLRDRVQVVEQQGVRMITGLDKMSATHNILQPISEIAQADPDWSPRIVEVYIDPTLDPPKDGQRVSYSGRHVYVQDKMLALRKDAIYLIAKAAGIDVDVDEVDRRKLKDTEIAYKAIATMRRSDGTLERWPGGRKLDVAVEREKVKAQCTKDGQLNEDYFRKRWATELDFLPQKCESKAVLRAVSAALQLKRGGYTPEELSKPFLVIAWSFTPSDPELRRELALAAAGIAYGRRAISAPAEIVVEHPPVEADDAPDPEDVFDHVPATAAEPRSDEPDPVPVAGEIPPDIHAAGSVVVPAPLKPHGKQIHQLDVRYLDYLVGKFKVPEPEAIAEGEDIEAYRTVKRAAETFLPWRAANPEAWL